jgi:hypothetical protein
VNKYKVFEIFFHCDKNSEAFKVIPELLALAKNL